MGATIAQLLIALGPSALNLIPTLIAIWNKPTLSPEEVITVTAVCGTTYEAYIAQGKAALAALPPNPPPVPVG